MKRCAAASKPREALAYRPTGCAPQGVCPEHCVLRFQSSAPDFEVAAVGHFLKTTIFVVEPCKLFDHVDPLKDKTRLVPCLQRMS